MKKTTIKTIQKLKKMTSKDYFFDRLRLFYAKYMDEAGVDIILVGDSLAWSPWAMKTTHAIGMEEMLVFTKAVAKGAQRALLL